MKKIFLMISAAGIIIAGAVTYIQAEDNPHYVKGEKLFNEQKYDEAVGEFKKGLDTDNKDDKKALLAYIGYAYQLQSKFTEAVKY
jgi:hypothetical protein